MQTARPWLINRCDRSVHLGCGKSRIRSCSTFSGSVAEVRRRRRAIRPTCVSTVMPSFLPKALPRTTLAVFRPTPGRARSSSIVSGTRPACRSTSAAAMARRLAVLFRKNPVERIRSSTSPCEAPARVRGSGKRAKSAGVTRLTRTSVHWAERMVATAVVGIRVVERECA
jgi:hypothetical protein